MWYNLIVGNKTLTSKKHSILKHWGIDKQKNIHQTCNNSIIFKETAIVHTYEM